MSEETERLVREARERELLKLLDARYQACLPPKGASHEQEWHRRSGVTCPKEDGETLQGQIQIRRHDLQAFGYPQHSYQLGAILPTRLGWFKAKFYGLSATELLIRLPELEVEIVELQKRLLAEEPQ